MNHVTNVNSGATLITYDGDGNRASKTVTATGTTTYYLLDDRNPSGYVQVLEEWTSTGIPSLSKVYNYGLALINQRMPGVSTNYFVCDGHSSTRMLTDIGGGFVNAFAYDAYGNLIASNGSPQTAYLYCGEYFDSDLGFINLRARLDNPQTGRFLTSDSAKGNNQDPLSLHRYTYAQDDPVDNVDPSGHDIGEMLAVVDVFSSFFAMISPATSVADTAVHPKIVLVDIGVDSKGAPSAFDVSDIQSKILSQLSSKLFNNLAPGQSVQIKVHEGGSAPGMLGWLNGNRYIYISTGSFGGKCHRFLA
jgi:RHS repeat-associated protein